MSLLDALLLDPAPFNARSARSARAGQSKRDGPYLAQRRPDAPVKPARDGPCPD